ncbi:hypothetical protein Y032_0045g1099 [Ancylostoma ceylanicum]|uniref:Uncharacterized protein n=1 Tax=Ancylostoma ceylanicum TaxID=53326 RepID=A0A016UCB0_9BILA|nr:hypothetical protein Y032_0045g1099 [Ancylostoma ceylanicum]
MKKKRKTLAWDVYDDISLCTRSIVWVGGGRTTKIKQNFWIGWVTAAAFGSTVATAASDKMSLAPRQDYERIHNDEIEVYQTNNH